jgi:hypothetical protein
MPKCARPELVEGYRWMDGWTCGRNKREGGEVAVSGAIVFLELHKGVMRRRYEGDAHR